MVETQGHKDSLHLEDKNCIKWNWSLLARGVLLFDYEVHLAGNLTAEVGVGITYRDFEYEATKGSNLGGDTLESFISSNSYGSASISYAGEAGLRYYLQQYDDMEGPYVEATVSFRNYSFPNPTLQSGSLINTSSSFVPGYSFLDGQFKFGYQFSHWFNDLLTDFYVGFGLRNMTAKMYESVEVPYTTNYYTTSYNTYVKGITLKQTYLQPILGFKLGIPF